VTLRVFSSSRFVTNKSEKHPFFIAPSKVYQINKTLYFTLHWILTESSCSYDATMKNSRLLTAEMGGTLKVATDSYMCVKMERDHFCLFFGFSRKDALRPPVSLDVDLFTLVFMIFIGMCSVKTRFLLFYTDLCL